MKLDDLKLEFKRNYPKIDYFTQCEIFKYIDMGFCLGVDSKSNRFNGQSKKVIRSDGLEYNSLSEAARKNHKNQSTISRAIKKGNKSAGYNWKYA